MNRPHFRTPYSEGCFRRNTEESVGLESLASSTTVRGLRFSLPQILIPVTRVLEKLLVLEITWTALTASPTLLLSTPVYSYLVASYFLSLLLFFFRPGNEASY